YTVPSMTWARTLVFLCSTSCSFVLVQGPPEHHEQLPYFDCTESRAGPILDTIWTALMAVGLIDGASTSQTDWDQRYPNLPRGVGRGMLAVFGALGVAGMWYGYTRTADCREARQQWMMRPPGAWPPPTQGPPPATPPAPGTPPPRCAWRSF